MATIALAGDTMLGRGVATALASTAPEDLVADEVAEATRAADAFVMNLECCISDRGSRWPDPRKAFHFRAPPIAVETLSHLGVDAVTLANNHALDFGEEALADTLDHLGAAGIAVTGAGDDVTRARQPATLDLGGARLAVVGVSDHPEGFAARPDRPGIAHAELRDGVPSWLPRAVDEAAEDADIVLLTPHWGPNMTTEPVAHVRAAADVLAATAVSLIAGHSAHVFHGVEVRTDGGGSTPVLYDLGDFIDDYAVDPALRNDLGLLWLVAFVDGRARRLEALPLALGHCYTRVARGGERTWIEERFTSACAAHGTAVEVEGGRLVADLGAPSGR